MKSFLLYLWRAILFLLSFIALYVAFSFLLSWIPVNTDQPKVDRSNRLYVFSNGVHLDLVIPTQLIPEKFLSQLRPGPDTQLLGIGWGDKGFYLDTPTWADLSAKVAIKAMFLPSPTAMHVTEHRVVNRTWSQLDLTDAQLEELFNYILASFQTDTAGKITELVGEGYTPLDRFYEANGNYSCFKTCNTWVNTGLRRIGVKTAIWTPMDKGVLRYLPTVGTPPTSPAS
ncbi:MAG: TIGR02117 family protein [Lewinella sp.]